MFNDTVLNTVPMAIVAQAMEEAFKSGHVGTPGSGRYNTTLQGPLYLVGSEVLTADEISWGLRRGYIRSQFIGRTVTVGTKDHNFEEFVKPRIEYTITTKGRSTTRWI